MKESRLLVALACLAGCAPAARPAAHATRHSAAHPAAAWREYSLPLRGLRARFPSPPDEAAGDKQQNGTTLHYAGFSLEKKGTAFLCLIVATDRRAKDKVALANAVKLLGPGAHQVRSFVEKGFRGVDAAGKDEDGANIVRRFIVVGNGMILASITAKDHAIDPTVAKRFVDGCSFDVPWRVAPWVAEGMTVSVPADAIERDNEKAGAETKTRTYYLGGVDALTFLVASTRLDASVMASPGSAGAILDHAASNMASSGYRIQFTSPVEHDGVRGRELLMTKKHQLRWRLFIIGDRLYQVGVIADRAAALRGRAALRFFDSVTWRRRPAP